MRIVLQRRAEPGVGQLGLHDRARRPPLPVEVGGRSSPGVEDGDRTCLAVRPWRTGSMDCRPRRPPSPRRTRSSRGGRAEHPRRRLVEPPVGKCHRRIDRLEFALQVEQVGPVPGQKGVAGVRLVVGVVGVHVPIALERAEAAVVQPGQGTEEADAFGDGQGWASLRNRTVGGNVNAGVPRRPAAPGSGRPRQPGWALESAEDPEGDGRRRRWAGSGSAGRRPRRPEPARTPRVHCRPRPDPVSRVAPESDPRRRRGRRRGGGRVRAPQPT